MARLSVKELEKLAGKSFEEIQAGEQAFKRNSAFDIDRNLDVLNALKDQVKAGDLTVAEFLDRSQPFAEEANRSLLGANDPSLFGRIPQLRQFANFDTTSGLGQITDARLPFSSREFARLPGKVLPSLDEVNQGIIPVDVLPPGAFERIQRDQEEAGRVPVRRPTDPSLPEPGGAGFAEQIERISQLPPDQQQSAFDELLGTIEQQRAGTDLQSELSRIGQLPPGQQQQALLELQQRQQQQGTQIPDPQRPGQFINIPVVGDISNITAPQTRDQSIIEAEARRQEEQQRRAFEGTRALREQQFGALETSLGEQTRRSFEQFIPQAADVLQTKGLLQTSELENVLGREQGRLAGQTQDILAQARLGGTTQDISRIDDILRARQGLQQSGLERRFSIQDFERQATLARQLGAQTTPQVAGGKGSQIGGGISGAIGGASLGSAAGIPGAIAGGIFGGAGGFLSG